MAADNLSVVLKCKDEIILENRQIPEPGENDVLIGIHTVGICGSDVHYWKNGRIGDFIVEKPMVLGHESSGTIVKVGSKVKTLKPGDRVCIEPGIPCRMCEFCKGGSYNLCPDVQFNATPPVDGSLCRYYTHPADFCYKLPDHVTLEEGALMEPLSVAVHACKRASVTAGKKVLITGADISESRLAVAKNLGASYQVCVKGKSDEESMKEVIGSLGGRPDITIECSGAESSIRFSILVTKSGGTIVLVGLGPPEIKIPIVNAATREIDIRGVFRYANSYPTALELVASGVMNIKPLITHRFKIEDSVKAFETAHSGTAIKVLIQCHK